MWYLEECLNISQEIDDTVVIPNCLDSDSSLKLGVLEQNSKRIKDLRQLVMKRKIHVEQMMNKVEGEWKTSTYAAAISY